MRGEVKGKFKQWQWLGRMCGVWEVGVGIGQGRGVEFTVHLLFSIQYYITVELV